MDRWFVAMVKVLRPLSPCPVVHTLEDSFRWVDHAVNIVCHEFGLSGVEYVVDSLANTSISTAFSGIGSAEIANDTLAYAFEKLTGETNLHRRTLFAIEHNDESVFELLMLPHGPVHVYSDMNDFLHIGDHKL